MIYRFCRRNEKKKKKIFIRSDAHNGVYESGQIGNNSEIRCYAVRVSIIHEVRAATAEASRVGCDSLFFSFSFFFPPTRSYTVHSQGGSQTPLRVPGLAARTEACEIFPLLRRTTRLVSCLRRVCARSRFYFSKKFDSAPSSSSQ